MTLAEVKKIIEKRKYDIIHILKCDNEEMELSKQHQLYGAIRELETTLRIITFYHDQEIKQKTEYKFQKEPREDLRTKISLRLKR